MFRIQAPRHGGFGCFLVFQICHLISPKIYCPKDSEGAAGIFIECNKGPMFTFHAKPLKSQHGGFGCFLVFQICYLISPKIHCSKDSEGAAGIFIECNNGPMFRIQAPRHGGFGCFLVFQICHLISPKKYCSKDSEGTAGIYVECNRLPMFRFHAKPLNMVVLVVSLSSKYAI